jgi:hypothetical protein
MAERLFYVMICTFNGLLFGSYLAMTIHSAKKKSWGWTTTFFLLFLFLAFVFFYKGA